MVGSTKELLKALGEDADLVTVVESEDALGVRLKGFVARDVFTRVNDVLRDYEGRYSSEKRGWIVPLTKASLTSKEPAGQGKVQTEGYVPYERLNPDLQRRAMEVDAESVARAKSEQSKSTDTLVHPSVYTPIQTSVAKTSPQSSDKVVVVLKPWPRMVDFLPLLSTAEREALKESLKQYGLKHPILVLKDGRIIDGHHRWELLEGKVPDEKVEVLDLDDETAFGLGISLNMDRRQLSPEIIKELREWQYKAASELRKQGKSLEETSKITGVPIQTISRHENESNSHLGNTFADLRVSIPKTELPKIVERAKRGETREQIAADYKITPQRIGQILRQAEARRPEQPMDEYHPLPSEKKYKCIVIDPPWEVQKIEREVRPDQGKEVDYPTLTLEQIGAIPLKDVVYESGCHVYLWVTHKHLPDGLALFEKWGIKYQCVLTWVKNVGFTPFSWMYSTEHILFGRIGNLDLLKLGKRLDFQADVREHSRKPEEFYALVREVSPEPRLDMFSREKHEGFDQYGNEKNKFSEATKDAVQ